MATARDTHYHLLKATEHWKEFVYAERQDETRSTGARAEEDRERKDEAVRREAEQTKEGGS
jgi:hypothetical protein